MDARGGGGLKPEIFLRKIKARRHPLPDRGASGAAGGDGGAVHANLAGLPGLTRQPRRYLDIGDRVPRVQQVYRRTKPQYDRLWQHRIRVGRD